MHIPSRHKVVMSEAMQFATYLGKFLEFSSGIAPSYLSELCIPVASALGCQHLRSASTGLLQVPRARTTIGRWSFAVVGPSLWNVLPAALQRHIKQQTYLLTYLFSQRQ